MEKRGLPFTLVITISFAVVGALLSLIFARSIDFSEGQQRQVAAESAPRQLERYP